MHLELGSSNRVKVLSIRRSFIFLCARPDLQAPVMEQLRGAKAMMEGGDGQTARPLDTAAISGVFKRGGAF